MGVTIDGKSIDDMSCDKCGEPLNKEVSPGHFVMKGGSITPEGKLCGDCNNLTK